MGLRVGSEAPHFSLPTISTGELSALEDLLANNRPVLLVFVDPACGSCTYLLPDVARWQHEHSAEILVALITTGRLEANRQTLAEQPDIRYVFIQEDREVARRYNMSATPTAVIIDPDGTIASPVAAGAEAIRRLAASITAGIERTD